MNQLVYQKGQKMDFDGDLDRWMVFEALSIASGDHLLCPACDIGIINQDDSGSLWCDVCNVEFEIENE